MNENKRCEVCGSSGAVYQSTFTFLDPRSHEVLKPKLDLCYTCKLNVKSRRANGLSSPTEAVEVAKKKAGLVW